MTTPDNDAPDVDSVESEAIAWFSRNRSGTLRPEEDLELKRWLSVPDHAAAFAALEELWHSVEPLHDNPRLLVLREEARKSDRPQWLAMCASVVACIMVAGSIPSAHTTGNGPPPEIFKTVQFATTVGQQLPIALADGSRVTLDANSALSVTLNDRRREIRIARGRAFFQVSHDPQRPFVVSSGDRSVTALGTAFSVDTSARRLDVVLVQGKVRVEERQIDGRRAMEMTAGSHLQITADGAWRAERADPAIATAWLHGQLMFDNTSLADVVEKIQLYTDRKIAIAPDGTGDRRLSAVLKAGDVGTFVESVRMLRLAKVETMPDGSIRLSQK